MTDSLATPLSGGASDVLCGQDGWLFLVGGSNRVQDLFGETSSFDNVKIAAWSSLLFERLRRAQEIGADYLHAIVPEKITLYSELCELSGVNFGNSPLRRLHAQMAKAGFTDLVNCLTPMLRQKRYRNLYYKTDTHWNFHGCLCAYLEVCRMAGAIPAGHVLAPPFGKTMLTLDLGSKLPRPVEEEFRVYNFIRHSTRIFANELVSYKERIARENDGGLHVGSQVVFRNEAPTADPRRVILFGDSFSEYRRHLLTGLLAETFREVHFVWSTNVDWTYVRAHKPDLLLTEIAERFLTSVPNDNFSLEEYTKKKMEALVAVNV